MPLYFVYYIRRPTLYRPAVDIQQEYDNICSWSTRNHKTCHAEKWRKSQLTLLSQRPAVSGTKLCFANGALHLVPFVTNAPILHESTTPRRENSIFVEPWRRLLAIVHFIINEWRLYFRQPARALKHNTARDRTAEEKMQHKTQSQRNYRES